MPCSLSRDPGCAMVICCWKQCPVFQSQKCMEPLSPPDTRTPSSLTASAFTMVLCPLRLCRNSPSGNFHRLRLSAEADTKVYSRGWSARARTPFLWLVRVTRVRPAAKSHRRTQQSIEPEITWGSADWAATETTVSLCPESTCTGALVRMSQTRTVASRPPVQSTSRPGWSAAQYTPERWPWYARMVLLVSRSQHLTILSSPAEKRYGCRSEMQRPRMVEMCPVSVSLSLPVASSQILMVRSLEPVANHSLVGSTAIARTQPRWPEMTRMSFHGGCQSGFGRGFAARRPMSKFLLAGGARTSAPSLDPAAGSGPAAAPAGSTCVPPPASTPPDGATLDWPFCPAAGRAGAAGWASPRAAASSLERRYSARVRTCRLRACACSTTGLCA
mmetsp:Transcript_22014/g.74034  ORF Transcript_22014/g.74034 Transcript_22014/m.74034 type:complete len:388 (+) Transcript_22014:235-1398(+)